MAICRECKYFRQVGAKCGPHPPRCVHKSNRKFCPINGYYSPDHNFGSNVNGDCPLYEEYVSWITRLFRYIKRVGVEVNGICRTESWR